MTYEEAKKNIIAYVYAECENIPEQVLQSLNLMREATEKQIPKKPRITRCALMCAACKHKITEKGCQRLNRNYCKVCGQRIDWSESQND